ncbi:hypothetical protein [Treponema primitia]|uniref:hypothetical protein n=1 Tax=Treponema primitia TaxID=88058 RepID=UPI0002D9ED90|nr:hypothetical protein [Treponema primitia]
MKRTIYLIRAKLLLIGLIGLFFAIALTGCPTGNDDPDIWLAELSNPFLGKWESDIPSAQMHLIFDYKTDGTFDYEIPGMPADEGGKGSGGYLVTGNIMVSYLSFEGAAGYTFKVVDNDTIDVTEIETVKGDGSFVLGETAPFTRVAGSAVNKENKPFVLNHPYLGKWHFEMDMTDEEEFGDTEEHHIIVLYEAKADGTLAYDFTMDDIPIETSVASYFIFNNTTLVSYEAAEGFGTGTITPHATDPNTIYLAEEGESPVPLTRVP